MMKFLLVAIFALTGALAQQQHYQVPSSSDSSFGDAGGHSGPSAGFNSLSTGKESSGTPPHSGGFGSVGSSGGIHDQGDSLGGFSERRTSLGGFKERGDSTGIRRTSPGRGGASGLFAGSSGRHGEVESYRPFDGSQSNEFGSSFDHGSSARGPSASSNGFGISHFSRTGISPGRFGGGSSLNSRDSTTGPRDGSSGDYGESSSNGFGGVLSGIHQGTGSGFGSSSSDRFHGSSGGFRGTSSNRGVDSSSVTSFGGPGGLRGGQGSSAVGQGGFHESGPIIPILSDNREGPIDGYYTFEYQTGDGINREEEGNPTGPFGAVVQQGSWSFTFPDGTPGEFSFVADENGYRVDSPLLPTPPPLPPHAIAQIEKAEREREAGITHDGVYSDGSDEQEFGHGGQRDFGQQGSRPGGFSGSQQGFQSFQGNQQSHGSNQGFQGSQRGVNGFQGVHQQRFPGGNRGTQSGRVDFGAQSHRSTKTYDS